MKRDFTCIVCPKGCLISVEYEGTEIKNIEGHTCKRGVNYVTDELTCPKRTLTTTVAAKNGIMVPVRTNKTVPKEKLFDLMGEINKIVLDKSVKTGDIIVKDILETDADLIASTDAQIE